MTDSGLQNRRHTYSWYNHEGLNNGGFAGYQNKGQCTHTRCDTSAYIAAVNKLGLCGRDKWRLPTLSELTGLVDYSISFPGPTIDQQRFPNTASQFYWSATPSADNQDSAWGMGFVFGYNYAYFKSDHGRVRLVHDPLPPQAPLETRFNKKDSREQLHPAITPTSPTHAFIDNGNGTVTDQRTGLIWMRCPVGQEWQEPNCRGQALAQNIQLFRQITTDFHYAGHNDWRIPDIKELSSITELARTNPAINVAIFPDTAALSFWSNTVFANDANKQWLVQFHFGENHVDDKSVRALMRLVRYSQYTKHGDL